MPRQFDDEFSGNSSRDAELDALMKDILELTEDYDQEEDFLKEEESGMLREELYFETEEEDDEEQKPKKGRKAGKILVILLCVILGIALVAVGATFAMGALTGEEPEVVLIKEDVPSLVGMDYATLPEGMKITVVKAGEEYSDAVPAGQIIRQEPAADTQVEPGSQVKVVVSLGQEPAKVAVPDDFLGKTKEDVESWILKQEISLNLTTEEGFSGEAAAGTIMKITPEAGTILRDGDTLLLTISKGNTSAVPKVTGMQEDKALETLKAAGFENVKTVAVKSEEAAGTVLTQSMGEGETMKVSNLIVLRVAAAEAKPAEAAEDAAPDATEAVTEPEKTVEATEPEETVEDGETEATEAETEAAEAETEPDEDEA